MTKDEFIQQIQSIGTCSDDVERRTMLSNMETGVSQLFDDYASVKESNTSLTTDNENLRKANMQLFSKVGQKLQPESTGLEPEQTKQLKYEDLFNENGGLK